MEKVSTGVTIRDEVSVFWCDCIFVVLMIWHSAGAVILVNTEASMRSHQN